jgi:hypothetical protein
MRLFVKSLTVIGIFATTPLVFADALEQTLQTMLQKKERHGDINLDYLNLNAQVVVPKVSRTFEIDEIVATYEAIEIRKKEADAYLARVTENKSTDYNKLVDEQRFALIEELLQFKLIAKAANEAFTEEEKGEIFKGVWIAQKRASTEVSNDELVALYEKKKGETLARSSNANIPTFMSVADKLKSEIIENKILMEVMQNASIEILD